MLNLKSLPLHTALIAATMTALLALAPQQAAIAATKIVTKTIVKVGKDEQQASTRVNKAARKQLGKKAELVGTIDCEANPTSKRKKNAIQCSGTFKTVVKIVPPKAPPPPKPPKEDKPETVIKTVKITKSGKNSHAAMEATRKEAEARFVNRPVLIDFDCVNLNNQAVLKVRCKTTYSGRVAI